MPLVRRLPLPNLDSRRRPFDLRDAAADYWRIIGRATRPGDWHWLDDGWMILKADPAVQVRREPGIEDCSAGWTRDCAWFEPYCFVTTFWWGRACMARLEMIQLTPAVELPLPHPFNQGLQIDDIEYRWAKLKSVDVRQLDSCLRTAGIEVVAYRWFDRASARALRATRRVWLKLRPKRSRFGYRRRGE